MACSHTWLGITMNFAAEIVLIPGSASVSGPAHGNRPMLHYSCDMCKRPLDPDDNLREIHEILERMDDSDSQEIGDDVYQQLRFDLCPECRKRFLKNPLGRKPAEQFDFSKN